jgi:hypothetical protein
MTKDKFVKELNEARNKIEEKEKPESKNLLE